jgi:hypothetical protein
MKKRRSAPWREHQHPRDDIGRFTSGRGSRAWAQRVLTQISHTDLGRGKAGMSGAMSRMAIRPGAPSGRIDLGAVLAQNRSFHPAPRSEKRPGELRPGDVVEIPATRQGVAPVRGVVNKPPLVRPKVDTVVELDTAPRDLGPSNYQRQLYLKPNQPVKVLKSGEGPAPETPSVRVADFKLHKGETVTLTRKGDQSGSRVELLTVGKAGDGSPAIKIREKVKVPGVKGTTTRERVVRQDEIADLQVVDVEKERSINRPAQVGDARSERFAKSVERGLRSGAVAGGSNRTRPSRDLTRNVSTGKMGGMETPAATPRRASLNNSKGEKVEVAIPQPGDQIKVKGVGGLVTLEAVSVDRKRSILWIYGTRADGRPYGRMSRDQLGRPGIPNDQFVLADEFTIKRTKK